MIHYAYMRTRHAKNLAAINRAGNTCPVQSLVTTALTAVIEDGIILVDNMHRIK